LLCPLLLTGCISLSPPQRARIDQIITQSRSTTLTCGNPDTCDQRSPLYQQAREDLIAIKRGDTLVRPFRQHALLLDYGQDALLARLALIRSAKSRIDLQTYIFDEDDAGHLILDELLKAARRGVRVRVLVDQLSALRQVQTLAALAGAHANFNLRIYNPLFGKARIAYPHYALAVVCCWRQLNQRMHNKLLLVDGLVGITGGRNYQNDYYDWNPVFNYRDRDVLVTGGGVTHTMRVNFEAFWQARLSVPVEQLRDVGHYLLRHGVPALPQEPFTNPARVAAISRDADDAELIRQRLLANMIEVNLDSISFISDVPGKHRRNRADEADETETDRADNASARRTAQALLDLVAASEHEVLLQTPYLVLSKPARALFTELHARPEPPRVLVSTNSLAATDAFITYALSYKYKRRYLREYGFEMYEFKPFPEDAMVDLDATGAVDVLWDNDGTVALDARPARAGPRRRPALSREYAALRYAGIGVNRRVPVSRTGVRFGLHAKSLVVDEKIGVVGTHNFDPRGRNYNTENAVIIKDAAFAQALAASIRRSMRPENAWVIAPRKPGPVLSGINYSLGKVSEHLPIFDLWPVRYATSYEFTPSSDCPLPLPPSDPDFLTCYTAVGDFPEVVTGWRRLLTRIFTAFGAGLAPIL